MLHLYIIPHCFISFCYFHFYACKHIWNNYFSFFFFNYDNVHNEMRYCWIKAQAVMLTRHSNVNRMFELRKKCEWCDTRSILFSIVPQHLRVCVSLGCLSCRLQWQTDVELWVNLGTVFLKLDIFFYVKTKRHDMPRSAFTWPWVIFCYYWMRRMILCLCRTDSSYSYSLTFLLNWGTLSLIESFAAITDINRQWRVVSFWLNSSFFLGFPLIFLIF